MNKKVIVFFCSSFCISFSYAMQQGASPKEYFQTLELDDKKRTQAAAKILMNLHKANKKPINDCQYPSMLNSN